MSMQRRTLLTQISAGALVAALWPRAAAGQVVTYTYDELGRVQTVTSANGATITYTYDKTGNRQQVVQTPATGAPIGTFGATPTSIYLGSSATLSWSSNNATSASINNGVGSVTPVTGGSISVSPSATTTYTLTLTGPGGQTTLQATVTVTTTFTQTIQITGTSPVNLRTLADAAGYNGALPATITFQVGSAVTIMGAAGAPNGGICIDTGTWPSSSYATALSLQVSGKVYGGGGAGNSGAGGDAIYCRENIAITVNSGGQIKGGGGGGGSGGGWGVATRDPETGEMSEYVYQNGGGGGGGFPNGAGGLQGKPAAGAGSAGTTSGGGAGGIGVTVGTRTYGAGGAGGGAATSGASGTSATGAAGCGAINCWDGPGAGGVGGAAGYAIRKNGKTVTVTNNGGTITGTQA